MASLFLKALPLTTLRRTPSIFFLSRLSKTIPTLISTTRTLSSVSASIQQQQPLPSETETLISTAKPLNESLQWVSRTHHCGELSSDDVGKTVRLCGWVALHRVHGGLTFLNLRDHTGIIQVTTLPDEFPVAHSAINNLRLEYVVAIQGVVRSRPNQSINKKMKTGFIEIAASEVQLLNSVNAKLPFLVTTTDDAKDSLKEEVRLRYALQAYLSLLIYIYVHWFLIEVTISLVLGFIGFFSSINAILHVYMLLSLLFTKFRFRLIVNFSSNARILCRAYLNFPYYVSVLVLDS